MPSSGVNRYSCRPTVASHKRAASSLAPERSSLPSSLYASAKMVPLWPESVATVCGCNVPLSSLALTSKSQIRIVLSYPPDASR